MTNDQFLDILDKRLDAIRMLCVIKGQEYGKDDDRLCQFKKIAERQNITPEKALRVLVTKHLTAIDDHIDRISDGEVAPIEKWDEWLRDEILYAILLEGLIVERLGQPQIEQGSLDKANIDAYAEWVDKRMKGITP